MGHPPPRPSQRKKTPPTKRKPRPSQRKNAPPPPPRPSQRKKAPPTKRKPRPSQRKNAPPTKRKPWAVSATRTAACRTQPTRCTPWLVRDVLRILLQGRRRQIRQSRRRQRQPR